MSLFIIICKRVEKILGSSRGVWSVLQDEDTGSWMLKVTVTGPDSDSITDHLPGTVLWEPLGLLGSRNRSPPMDHSARDYYAQNEHFM